MGPIPDGEPLAMLVVLHGGPTLSDAAASVVVLRWRGPPAPVWRIVSVVVDERTSEVVDVCVRLVVVVYLVRADLRLMDAALVGDDALGEALGHDVAAGWASFTGALKPTRDALAADPEGAVWGTRFFVDGDPPELVGWGGFKGPPQGGDVPVLETLVAIGNTDHGDLVLLDLESLGAVWIDGDLDSATALLRSIVAELVLQPLNHYVDLVLVGDIDAPHTGSQGVVTVDRLDETLVRQIQTTVDETAAFLAAEQVASTTAGRAQGVPRDALVSVVVAVDRGSDPVLLVAWPPRPPPVASA